MKNEIVIHEEDLQDSCTPSLAATTEPVYDGAVGQEPEFLGYSEDGMAIYKLNFEL